MAAEAQRRSGRFLLSTNGAGAGKLVACPSVALPDTKRIVPPFYAELRRAVEVVLHG